MTRFSKKKNLIYINAFYNTFILYVIPIFFFSSNDVIYKVILNLIFCFIMNDILYNWIKWVGGFSVGENQNYKAGTKLIIIINYNIIKYQIKY